MSHPHRIRGAAGRPGDSERAPLVGAKVGVGLADEFGKFVVFNRRAEQLLGIGVEGAANRPAGSRLNAVENAGGFASLDSLLARAMCGQRVPATRLFVRNERSQHGFWIDATARPLLNDSGDVCGGVVIFEKRPRKSRLEQAKRVSPSAQTNAARRLELITPSAAASLRSNLELRAAERLLASGQTVGCFKEEKMSDATLNLTFSSPINHQVRHVVRLVRSGDLDGGAGDDGRRPDDIAVRGERHPTPPHDSDLGAATSLHDFARAAKLNGFSTHDQDHIRMLLDSAAEAICEIDLAGHCTFANPACAKLLGYADVQMLIGKNMHALTHPRRADGTPYPEEECPIHHSFRRDQDAHVEEEVFWRKDGSRFYAECRSLPILRGNRVIGAVVTFLDISERKRLEEQLRHAQKMEAVGQLVGGIAHDFNNFLTAINIYNELLKTSLGSNVPAQQLLQEIKDATERSASLTRQLLAFGRKEELPPQKLCVNDVVRSAERLLRRVIGDDVYLETDLEPLLDEVKADPEQLERVLLNLVVNARHAMPQGGTITIASANAAIDGANADEHPDIPAGRYVVLSVTDTGSGMSQDVRRQIFDPYFTTKATGEGSGLGLAVVQGIVKQIKGYIKVDSEPGRGAYFRIYLPCADQAKTHEPPQALAPPRGGETILLVDRDDALRIGACELLRQFGIQPLEASSSDEALLVSSRSREPIAMLVIGASIPPAESQALAERLLATRPALKTLCLSEIAERAALRYDAAHEPAAPHRRHLSPISLSEQIRQALDGD